MSKCEGRAGRDLTVNGSRHAPDAPVTSGYAAFRLRGTLRSAIRAETVDRPEAGQSSPGEAATPQLRAVIEAGA